VTVDRCKTVMFEGQLIVVFRHTNGHQSAIGDDEVAAYNARADALASTGAWSERPFGAAGATSCP